MIQEAYGNETMSHVRCLEWYSHFKNWKMKRCQGNLPWAHKNVVKIRQLVHENRWLYEQSVHCWYHQCVIQNRSGSPYIDLNMHRIAAKFMPKDSDFSIESSLCQTLWTFLSAGPLGKPQHSCQESSMGMRLGFVVTIQRSNNTFCSGRAQHLQDQKRIRQVTMCHLIALFMGDDRCASRTEIPEVVNVQGTTLKVTRLKLCTLLYTDVVLKLLDTTTLFYAVTAKGYIYSGTSI